MWSTWHQAAGTWQLGWQHSRSRTSMARRVAPVKHRWVGGHSTRGTGAKTASANREASTVRHRAVAPMPIRPSDRYSARSRSAPGSQSRSSPGGTTVPSSSWQILPCRVS